MSKEMMNLTKELTRIELAMQGDINQADRRYCLVEMLQKLAIEIRDMGYIERLPSNWHNPNN